MTDFFTSTTPILLTPLPAIQMLPFLSGIMWRTTPPPDGMTQLWNFSVLGSKRTMVFGLTPDSFYQMMSFATVIP